MLELKSGNAPLASAEERDEWLRALREAIADNASRRSTFQQVHLLERLPSTSFTLGKQAPVWIPDYRVTMCQHCTATFTLTFRRHHCRACGKVVCDPCSSNRAPLLYKKNKVERVCDLCFEVLQQDFEKKSKDLQENGQHQQQHEDGQKGKEPDNLKAQFRRGMRESKSNRIRNKRKVPERLMEVCANDISSQMSGYLQMMVRRSWRRGWFVLKDRVLYEYRAPQDVCALYSLPVLGYKVEAINKDREVTEDVDDCLAFQLTHLNQSPLIFQTDSPHLAEKQQSGSCYNPMGDLMQLRDVMHSGEVTSTLCHSRETKGIRSAFKIASWSDLDDCINILKEENVWKQERSPSVTCVGALVCGPEPTIPGGQWQGLQTEWSAGRTLCGSPPGAATLLQGEPGNGLSSCNQPMRQAGAGSRWSQNNAPTRMPAMKIPANNPDLVLLWSTAPKPVPVLDYVSHTE
ncbi:FYVE, RhoGEF and PH domain-containing protein 6 [Portunus trituberculatus]|uniref:FYVE, RhoGEF and PH domain-containing protein 6 n=1 Tax=Portunus trituberculatus TaxID=210409 RepID=A0A5B7CZ36_PORTR|nr:FYVE, RhoGEF and PH domain-containing protein 6 [Portunus trituberculatus]